MNININRQALSARKGIDEKVCADHAYNKS